VHTAHPSVGWQPQLAAGHRPVPDGQRAGVPMDAVVGFTVAIVQ
jgi:hypothetical protein